jgi:hypothetical protein
MLFQFHEEYYLQIRSVLRWHEANAIFTITYTGIINKTFKILTFATRNSCMGQVGGLRKANMQWRCDPH